MAFITEQAGPIATIAAPLLARSLVLPQTVSRIPASDFLGPKGGRTTVRVPQPGTGEEQDAGGGDLTPEEINEIPVTLEVKLQQFLTTLDEYKLNLDIENFARQVTAIQVEAVARRSENKLAAVMNGLAADDSFAASASAADTDETIIAAVEHLDEADAPMAGRTLAVSPSIRSRMLAVDKFTRNDASGGDSALRQAEIGNIYGMRVVVSNALTPGTALAYHSSGFLYATFPPSEPAGAISAATQTYQGIPVRVLFQYASGNATEQALVSTFAGAAAVWEDNDESTPEDNYRWYKIDTASS